ncbi:MAG TPA: hypothetical protein PLV68_02755 [Ilumatobacteraceae bacterium]|nr:hypothetical protein [Ilumatobacteraceae bacterium]
MPAPNKAEIGAVADGVETYRSRTVGLAETLIGTSHEDLLATLWEAERALQNALRALQRAHKLSPA